eukprot:scaffold26545_cov66-Isochrysis_galbana.AAC.1
MGVRLLTFFIYLEVTQRQLLPTASPRPQIGDPCFGPGAASLRPKIGHPCFGPRARKRQLSGAPPGRVENELLTLRSVPLLPPQAPAVGGGTRFPRLNVTVAPKRGTALLWPNVLDDDVRTADMRTNHE